MLRMVSASVEPTQKIVTRTRMAERVRHRLGAVVRAIIWDVRR